MTLQPAAELLSPQARRFVAELFRKFAPARAEVLRRRATRQAEIDAGIMPDFLSESRELRGAAWTVAALPPEHRRRQVEISSPPLLKMIINGRNSGADAYIADFDDSHCPTWSATLEGQLHLRDAVRGDIEFTSAEGKRYAPNLKTARLMVRPRGWHLLEKHHQVDGRPVPASLFDFGLYFFHNAARLHEKGELIYFYLPKLEGGLEARLWNDVFAFAEAEFHLPKGTIRATAHIENVLAAFEMDEILYELKDHSAGLHCGRWDYILSFIRKFHGHPRFILPDRAGLTMRAHFLRSFSRLLVETCRRREAHAIGGMSACVPVKGDPRANERALRQFRNDKKREAEDGYDGTWVAHPDLVSAAREVFVRARPGPDRIRRKLDGFRIGPEDLLRAAKGRITEEGLRLNVHVSARYLQAWLSGVGCIRLDGRMEDAATAEISAAQVWQWTHHRAKTADGAAVTPERVEALLRRELASLQGPRGPTARILREIFASPGLPDLMTLKAYDRLS